MPLRAGGARQDLKKQEAVSPRAAAQPALLLAKRDLARPVILYRSLLPSNIHITYAQGTESARSPGAEDSFSPTLTLLTLKAPSPDWVTGNAGIAAGLALIGPFGEPTFPACAKVRSERS
jgi:hypothetical protein